MTDAHGVARFKVSSSRSMGPITYKAVDKAARTTFDQTVQIRFVTLSAAGGFYSVPIAMGGLLLLAGMAGLVLVVLQARRRRRSLARVEARHVS